MRFWKSVTSVRQLNLFAHVAGTCLFAAHLAGCGGPSNADLAQRMIQQRTLANQANEEEQEDKQPEREQPVAKKAGASTPAAATPQVEESVQAVATTDSTPVAATAEPIETAPQSVPFDNSSQNLTKIAAALAAHAQERGYLVEQGAGKKQPGLSWRVHLLPYLGHQDLYSQFDLQKNWNESPNRELISRMPDVYRCDGLFGPFTRFRAATGSGTVMGAAVPATLQQVSRPADTLLVVEHPARLGELWTQPGGFNTNISDEVEDLQDFASTRTGHLFGAFADGQAHPIHLPRVGGSLAGCFAFADPATPSRDSYIVLFDDSKMRFRGRPLTQPTPSWAVSPGPRDIAGSSDRGAGGSSSRASSGSGGGSRNASIPPDTLAGKCLAAAVKSKQYNDIPAMWSWLYCSVAAQLPTETWDDEFQWVAGLGRPTLGLHWAVGLRDRNAPAIEDDPEARYPNADTLEIRESILEITTDLGLPVLKAIEAAATESLPAALGELVAEQGSGRRGTPTTPPLTYLRPSRRLRDLFEDADNCGADVLVVFNVDRKSDRKALELQVLVCDVARRQQLKRTSEINKRGDRFGQAARENFQEMRWELEDYIEEQLTGSPWPAKLNEKIVAKLLVRLAALGSEFPLRQLVEMRYYRSIELADDAQLLEVGRELIGDSRSVNLLLGNDSKRERVLRRWFPANDLDRFLSGNLRTASRDRGNDDEDDD